MNPAPVTIRVVIIEDEEQAASRLKRMVLQFEPQTEIVATIDTVSAAVRWLNHNPAPDLIFMDIQLADGISFSIFEKVHVGCPIIFTTAYDAYALKAFKVNSVDYLLKPIDENELRAALIKFRDVQNRTGASSTGMTNVQEAIRLLTQKFKTRFVIKVGEHLRTVETSSLLYFVSKDKVTFGVAEDGRSHILDYTLEQLESMLDPDLFFRISRKYIVSSKSIRDIISYSNSRLKLIVQGCDDKEVIVARERVQDFRAWLDQ